MGTPVEFQYHDLVIFCDDFSNQNLLGEGGFAKVYKGIIPENNGYGLAAQLVAVKLTKFDVAPTQIGMQKHQSRAASARDKCISFIRQYENEKDCLSRFDHPNIIKLIGYCFSESAHCIVLEYAAEGKLTRHIEDLDWSSTLNIIKKLASAIEYIHSSEGAYLHGDIKCDNILLMEDNEPKLSDFGTMTQEGPSAKLVGTFGYLDPNVLSRGGVRLQSDDVYSFAVITLQMILKSSKVENEDGKHITSWAHTVYTKTGSLVDGRLLNTGCSEESAKIMYGVLKEFLIPPKETSVETRWKDFFALSDKAEDDTTPGTDESSTASSPGSPPSISEILIKLGEIKN